MGLDSFTILIVGGGPVNRDGLEDNSYMGELQQMASDYGIETKVKFTGWIPLDQMVEYVNTMDIVPFLEEDAETGSIVREAMACGRVALSVDGPIGTQRQIFGLDHSVLVESDDFIEESAREVVKLAKDRNRLEELGKNAAEHALKHFSFARQAKDILSFVPLKDNR